MIQRATGRTQALRSSSLVSLFPLPEYNRIASTSSLRVVSMHSSLSTRCGCRRINTSLAVSVSKSCWMKCNCACAGRAPRAVWRVAENCGCHCIPVGRAIGKTPRRVCRDATTSLPKRWESYCCRCCCRFCIAAAACTSDAPLRLHTTRIVAEA